MKHVFNTVERVSRLKVYLQKVNMRGVFNRVVRRFICLSVLGLSVEAHAATAKLIALGELAGGKTGSRAYGVSADGSVVVGRSQSAIGNNEAFRWTQATGMVGLGAFPTVTPMSSALNLSSDGSTAVGSGFTSKGTEAIRWTQPSGMLALGDLPGGIFESSASGVNSDGSVIVGQSKSGLGSELGIEAFRWTAAGGMVGLGSLTSEGGSGASDVSGDGSVVVGSAGSSGTSQAFRWTQAGGMIGLGDLPGGMFSSAAQAVSNDGLVVVGHGHGNIIGIEAFRWTQATGMIGLGDLPGGTFQSIALGVSGDGAVVVGQSGTVGGLQAFRWTEADGMELLADVLLANGVDPAAGGWTLLQNAFGVSDDGTTIVGYGIRNGFEEAFVAVVPEPMCVNLVFLAALGFVRRRRHS